MKNPTKYSVIVCAASMSIAFGQSTGSTHSKLADQVQARIRSEAIEQAPTSATRPAFTYAKLADQVLAQMRSETTGQEPASAILTASAYSKLAEQVRARERSNPNPLMSMR